ncbi:MAG: RNA pseudouridine synthase [Cyclobacteriaceae bacterium]|nr:RNA pseudouridine synthase [Cyclobacteriaceae bacterium]
MKTPRFDFVKSILFQDSDYIVINKPPFISTLEDRNDSINILALAKDFENDAQVCHRLDKDTSGVLAIAKNPEAYRHLSMQFENRQVNKVYHAVVDGIHDFNNELVDAPIEKQNDGTVKIARSGKSAQTYFTTLKTFKNHSLIECRPITGRMHQIRIHLSLLKSPITGDAMYGGKPFFISSIKRKFNLKKQTEEQPLMKRMALHAFSLEFELIKGEKKQVIAPYPKDFQALTRQLTENMR